MEFGEKIQKLRNSKNWTQEQLAEKLYISRTAVSKWESGKGYPNIDSLKDIAKIFDITIDDLLSGEQLIDIAKNENIVNMKKTNNFIYGLLDFVSILLIFIPIYANKIDNYVYSVSLINCNDINNIIKISYIIIFCILTLIGIVELIFNFIDNNNKRRILNILSIIIQMISILYFIISRQIYLSLFMLIILIIKILIVIKNISNIKDII